MLIMLKRLERKNSLFNDIFGQSDYNQLIAVVSRLHMKTNAGAVATIRVESNERTDLFYEYL